MTDQVAVPDRPPRRRPRAVLAEVGRGVTTVDRSGLRPGAAARAALGVALPLLVGILAGAPVAGAAAGAGALSVGFVSLQGTYRGRLIATLVAAAGMGASTVLGVLVEPSALATVVTTAGLGLVAGTVVCLGVSATATGIQLVVALLVVGQYDLTVGQAGIRGLEVLAGGLVQAVLVVLPWPLRRAPAERAALSRMYRALAGYARSDDDRPPHITTTQAAADVLADPQPFARSSDLDGYRDLLAEGDRIRSSLATLATARSRLPPGPALDALLGVAAAVGQAMTLLALAIRDDAQADRARLEPALRAAGLAATRLRQAAAPPWMAAQVDALLGQLRAARRSADLVAEHARSRPAHREHRRPGHVLGTALTTVRANLNLRSASFRHSLRLGAGLAVASSLSHLLHSSHAYWLTLTVLVVLRPDFGTTITRGAARVTGTLAGAVLATAVAAALHPSRPVLALLSVVVAYLGYLLVSVNYAAYAVCITSYLAFLLAFTGLPEATVAVDRALFTVAGGVLALLAYAVWPTWESSRLPEQLARLLRTQGDYVAALLAAWAEPDPSAADQRRRLRGQARLARSNAEASLARMLAEPHRPREIAPEVAREVVAAARRIAWSALALHAGRPGPDGEPGPDGTQELGSALRTTLQALADRIERRNGAGAAADAAGLRPQQTRLAALLSVGGGASTGSADGEGGDAFAVPLLVLETDALVDSVGTLAAALEKAAR